MSTPDPLLARGPAEREFLALFRKLDRQQQRDTLADMIRRLVLREDLPSILRRQGE